MNRVLVFVIGMGICAPHSLAQPRSPDDMISDLEQVERVRRALLENIDVDDEAVRQGAYPGVSFAAFDRDRDGSFYTGESAYGLYDYAIAITQYTHDDADLDGDGVPGFVELECARAGGPQLDPNTPQTTPGTPDGQVDCDGDGVGNVEEINIGLDPLNGDDGAIDSDHDGVPDAQEIAEGTRHTPVIFLREIEDPSDDHLSVEVMLDQDDAPKQPVLAELRLAFEAEHLAYDTTTLGAASQTAGGKSPFGVVLSPGVLRVTLTSTNLTRIGSGPLLNIRFRRLDASESAITFDLENSRLSPGAARSVQTFGPGHPNAPLVVGGE